MIDTHVRLQHIRLSNGAKEGLWLRGPREEVYVGRCAAQDRATSISARRETRDVAILKNVRALMTKLPRPKYRLYENRVGVRGTLLARTVPANNGKDYFVTEHEALLCLKAVSQTLRQKKIGCDPV